MKINGQSYRTIWPSADGTAVEIIDQTKLPHLFETVTLRTLEDAANAISDMLVRGAPLIGATGAYGLALAMRADAGDVSLAQAHDTLVRTRPTAVNLKWALDAVQAVLSPLPPRERASAAFAEAAHIADEDVETCARLGEHGLNLIRAVWESQGRSRPVNILTHCNAGWLATVDWGTATAPIYKAVEAGIPVHVYVDETRPRNQGASLTAYELNSENIPHTVIVDNAGGHLMQHGMIDLCIVGTDRTTANGDVANKIGTYLKALAAHDNGVPFYVALPSSTVDWSMSDGLRDIPIETRSPREVTHITGLAGNGRLETVQLTPTGSAAINYGFDVTPARLVTGLITERGVCAATREGLTGLFPERR
ncbi:MAG: S-methyl-5-thioribose-1-phosphate isomerase [Rhizobiales bacterium]|nr:S-methyl-5-thioribose-1-phosphate isomerase [Hyphomicrobiales bacterium]